jgi:hypothetical protein
LGNYLEFAVLAKPSHHNTTISILHQHMLLSVLAIQKTPQFQRLPNVIRQEQGKQDLNVKESALHTRQQDKRGTQVQENSAITPRETE